MSATLVIMAAGLGSRYGGIKQMEGVGPGGEILLEYAVFDALRAGFDHTVVILRPDIVEDFRDRVGRKLEAHTSLAYAVQSLEGLQGLPAGRTKPLGTVHAVLSARDAICGPFAVLNADDYYGPDAFVKMRGALDGLRGAEDACMVAYRLENTVSAFGAVTRGVCRAADGRLTSLCETHEIRLCPDGSIRSPEGPAPDGILDGASPVSMNFFGFSRAALDDMDVYFRAFLRALPPDGLKSECLVPDYVGERIRAGKLGVTVLTTDAAWFGMTYRDDRRLTADSLLALHRQGVYPPVLFA